MSGENELPYRLIASFTTRSAARWKLVCSDWSFSIRFWFHGRVAAACGCSNSMLFCRLISRRATVNPGLLTMWLLHSGLPLRSSCRTKLLRADLPRCFLSSTGRYSERSQRQCERCSVLDVGLGVEVGVGVLCGMLTTEDIEAWDGWVGVWSGGVMSKI